MCGFWGDILKFKLEIGLNKGVRIFEFVNEGDL